jgi:hypothetical protein
VTESGWSPAQFEDWLADQLERYARPRTA